MSGAYHLDYPKVGTARLTRHLHNTRDQKQIVGGTGCIPMRLAHMSSHPSLQQQVDPHFGVGGGKRAKPFSRLMSLVSGLEKNRLIATIGLLVLTLGAKNFSGGGNRKGDFVSGIERTLGKMNRNVLTLLASVLLVAWTSRNTGGQFGGVNEVENNVANRLKNIMQTAKKSKNANQNLATKVVATSQEANQELEKKGDENKNENKKTNQNQNWKDKVNQLVEQLCALFQKKPETQSGGNPQSVLELISTMQGVLQPFDINRMLIALGLGVLVRNLNSKKMRGGCECRNWSCGKLDGVAQGLQQFGCKLPEWGANLDSCI